MMIFHIKVFLHRIKFSQGHIKAEHPTKNVILSLNAKAIIALNEDLAWHIYVNFKINKTTRELILITHSLCLQTE